MTTRARPELYGRVRSVRLKPGDEALLEMLREHYRGHDDGERFSRSSFSGMVAYVLRRHAEVLGLNVSGVAGAAEAQAYLAAREREKREETERLYRELKESNPDLYTRMRPRSAGAGPT